MIGDLKKDDLSRVPETISFPAEEEHVLSYWKSERIFENCSKLSKGKPRYTFYDGPPFATGLPHYGHILAGTIKDIVTRYAYQQGYHVERRFGWDCHGLPVEYEIDKTLGIRGPEDVEKMGIAAYNKECRKIVMRYADEWEQIVSRMGRWIDFCNDYKTLYPWYMESIWWIFKQMFSKGLVYQGVKVMPYSTACTTPLSNFESGQNYKEIVDPSITVSFRLVDSPDDTSLLIWTTTPWTIPSNLAVCVNPNMTYVKVRENETKRLYILAESRLEFIFKTADAYTILETFPGKKLANLKYHPVFSYFVDYGKRMNAFRVLLDDYVTEDSGTGVVHQAPYHGEDDYRVSLANGVIAKDSEVICPIDDVGKFTAQVKDFEGQYFKDANKNIIAMIKERGNLFNAGQVKHSYPFCWRSDTPLIYKAVPSWFIRVEHMSQSLLNCSSQTYWVPEFVKEKRFGNWLKEARDWAVSRNRYWGTPIPIWMTPDGEEVICIGSIKELEQLSGRKVTDLHRESIDDIEIPSSRPGCPPLRRVKEVFDCWFESGSMPFAQQHFPFENEKDFMNCFPADFVAEGIDQTRGWFYTLIVVSTALFNKPPFKNLIASGLVLAADGQKMSKRKKNYPDPMVVVDKYGADALRLYLINSPVVRAENLRFKEEGVRDIIKDVFLPWYNAYRFFVQNVTRLEKEEHCEYFYDHERHVAGVKNAKIMDVWILSFKESLLDFITKEMVAYRLYTVVPRLTKFIDQLTNWYVRLNRRRIKGETGKVECIQSLDTLFDILMSMAKVMAPFTPFLSEYIYQRLNLLMRTKEKGSVHYQMIPAANRSLIKTAVELAVSRMQTVIELGRVMRDRRTLPVKYPVQEIIIIHKDNKYLDDVRSLESFILGELNVRKLVTTSDKEKYGITLRAEPDHKSLGQRLKGDFKAVMAAIKNLTDAEIQTHLSANCFKILGHEIDLSEVRIIYKISDNLGANFEAHSDNDVLVLMDMTPNEELMEEGVAREIINRIQKLKKKAQLVPTDPVLIFYKISSDSNNQLTKVTEKYKAFIETTVKSPFQVYSAETTGKKRMIIEESFDLKDANLNIVICSVEDQQLPNIPWTNVQLEGLIEPRYQSGREGMILLQHPDGKALSLEEFKSEIRRLFGLYGIEFTLECNKKIITNLPDVQSKVVLVRKTSGITKSEPRVENVNAAHAVPVCKFNNYEFDGKKFTILLENPKGSPLDHDEKYLNCLLNKVFQRCDGVGDQRLSKK